MLQQFLDGKNLYWLRILGLAALYYLGASLGKLIAIPPGNITALWPPSGIALAAVILLGYRYWPAVWLGSFAFNMVFFIQEGREIYLAYVFACVCVAAGASLQAVVAAYIAHKYFGYSSHVWNSGAFFKSIIVGALLCSTINATFGTTSFTLIKEVPIDQYINTWLTWWFGDTMGILVMTSFILVLAHQSLDSDFLQIRHRADRLWYLVSTLTILLVIGLTLAGYNVIRQQPGADAAFQATLVLLFGLILILTMTVLLFGLNATRSKAFQMVDETGKMLQDKTKALAILEKEIETFTRALSHDLQMPVRTIVRLSKSLSTRLSEKLTAEDKAQFQQVQASAKQIEQVVDELLGLSHITHHDLQREEVNLSVMCNSILASLLQQEPERTVRFSVADKVIVSADKQLLRTVMESLLRHAWKSTKNLREASIEFAHMQQDGQDVYYVKDNGPGFEPRHADQLFMPFQGGDITMAVAQRIIQRHEGRLWARGEKGKGATFYFTLAGQ